MARRRPPAPEDPKVAALRAAGALHPRPGAVQDGAFERQEFFDRVRSAYLARARLEPRRIRIVDATGTVDEVQRAVQSALRALLA